MRKLLIVENKSEIGAGTRGSSLGPGALKVVAHQHEDSFFQDHATLQLSHQNKELFRDVHLSFAKRIGGIVKVWDNLTQQLREPLRQGLFPLILSGDHSSAGGTIAAIASAFPEKSLGVVWIDAHADLHSPFTTPSGNVHGMPLAASLGLDNKANQHNVPDIEAEKHWNALKQVGAVSPKILPEHVIFMGVRDTEDPEDAFMRDYGLPNFRVEEIRELGAAKVAEMALQRLVDCDMIYLSFDVDCLDPSISRGTGTPVENGFFEEEAQEILSQLLLSQKVIALEITEVNPLLDERNKMAQSVYRILQHIKPSILGDA